MAIATITFSKLDEARLSSATLRTIASGMKRDGVVAFENLFPLDLLRRARADVLRRHRSGQLREQGLIRDIGGRYAALLPFEGPFLEKRFYANGKLCRMLAALLGEDHCIGSLEAVIALPGSSRQHQHIDGPIRWDQRVGQKKRHYQGNLSELPPYAVTLCIPLCDIEEANGPTALWPGSHRTALRPRPPSEAQLRSEFPVVHMTGQFGRSFLFDYRTFHGGTPNLTREPRPVLMCVFTRSWFRDPNLNEVYPRVIISARNLGRVPDQHKRLFMLAPAARRAVWSSRLQKNAGEAKRRRI